jgi:hypothetical protein
MQAPSPGATAAPRTPRPDPLEASPEIIISVQKIRQIYASLKFGVDFSIKRHKNGHIFTPSPKNLSTYYSAYN